MLKLVDSVNLSWYYISSTFLRKLKMTFKVMVGQLFKTTKIDFKSTLCHVAQDLRSKMRLPALHLKFKILSFINLMLGQFRVRFRLF